MCVVLGNDNKAYSLLLQDHTLENNGRLERAFNLNKVKQNSSH